MSNFAFLQKEWFSICDSATKAEGYLNTDTRAACWYARMTLEQIVDWLYRYDPNFKSYEPSLGARVHDPCFRSNAGENIFTKATVIMSIGNRAAHGKAAKQAEAYTAIQELFHISYWLARTYGDKARPDPSLQFDEKLIPVAKKQEIISAEQLRSIEDKLRHEQTEKDALKQELEALRVEFAKAKAANQQTPDTHNYNEEQTRDYFIDLLLNEAGWALDKKEDREYEVVGMPNNQGIGFVDYVLWGDDGKPLAVVEAKKTRRDARVGQQQAKLYADCLEAKFGRRPVIYYTNGYEHWFWDDAFSAPRPVEGFHKKDELELLMQRRSGRQSLAKLEIDNAIVERSYQHQAIRSITEAIEQHNQRRSLVVMATGSGKTRTVIALVDLLMRAGWVKRVLFLADRVSLVKQASREFGKHLPNVPVVNLLNSTDAQGRVYVSTYQTMLNQINNTETTVKKFGIGFFDLIIVDEAHRSIYSKYGAIFNYFDSYLVGLTATPKDEVDRNTYNLFQMQNGVPTYAYSLDDAITAGYLVRPKAISVPVHFPRDGIRYDELSEDERQQWDELEWGEDGPPDEVDPAAMNQWLFNQDTVDQIIQHMMTKGQKVASGDRIGKTIVFAKNNLHAQFIAERFNINYPQYKGEMARVITYQTEYAQSLIDDFSNKDKAPHIAISVDMLDTGIDVPEVVNLVFFKRVRSKTKFWQMIGRGTRLCKDLFAPNEDKKFFYILDYCQNLEYFKENPEASDGSSSDSLDAQLFKNRIEVLTTLDARKDTNTKDEQDLREYSAAYLHELVANMTMDNIVVRPKRKFVEKFSNASSWQSMTTVDAAEAATELANLPSQKIDSEEEAKRFDLAIIKLQLCVLRGDKGFERLQGYVKAIATALELQESIPAIRAQMELIQSLNSDDWWQDVTVGMLEHVRIQLRGLVKLIERAKRSIVFTNFGDTIGEGVEIDLPIKVGGLDYERFKAKSREFLRQHESKLAINKLRRNLPITATDLAELEIILLEQAGGDSSLIDKAKQEAHGLGLFVRSLVGLDKAAATEAMNVFLTDSTATNRQIEFVNLIVDELTKNGAMEDGRLYQSPFVDMAPTGPEGMFSSDKVQQLFSSINEVRLRAVA